MYVPVIPPPGVVRPTSPEEAVGRFWDANLVRWRAGKLLPIGGWERISEAALQSQARAIMPWTTNSGQPVVAFGCDDHLIALDGDVYNDITPDGFTGAETGDTGGYGAYYYGDLLYGDDTDATDPRPPSQLSGPAFSWTIDTWGGEILAVASSDGRLLHWAVGDPESHAVGYADITTVTRTSNIAVVVLAYSLFVVVGETVTIAGNPLAGVDGDRVVVSVISPTSFTFSNSGTNGSGAGGSASHGDVPTSNTGVIVTPERHAVLFGAGGVRRRVAWSNQEDYGNWDYSNTASLAGFFDLETDSRIIMAVPVREGTLLWTENEAWLMRYVGLPYVYGFERIGQGCGLIAPKSFAVTAGRCIWMGRESFWIYDGGNVQPLACDVASFVFDDIDSSSGSLYSHGAANGVFSEVWFWFPEPDSAVANKYVVYNFAENWWTIGYMDRTAAVGASVFPNPIATSSAGAAYFQEDGWTDAGMPLVNTRFVETGALNMQSGDRVSTISQAQTSSGYGYGSTSLSFVTSLTPDGPETSHGPFLSRADGYTDMRVTGRDIRVRVVSTQDAPWSMGGLRLQITPGGGR